MKIIKRVILVMLGVGMILWTGMVCGNKFFNRNFEKLSDIDKSMIEQLSEVYNTFEESRSEIWHQEYDFRDVPLVLTPVQKDRGVFHSYSYVIGVEAFENSLLSQKIEVPEHMNLPPIYRVSAVEPKLFMTFGPFNFTFTDISGQRSFLFKYTPESAMKKKTEDSFKYFMMHEAFHEYRQLKTWGNVTDGEPTENELISTMWNIDVESEAYQLFLTELNILDEANEIEDEKELRSIMTKWAMIRKHRYNEWDEMKEEKKIETLEGTAKYNEFAYSNLVEDELKLAYPKPDGTSYTYGEIFTQDVVESMRERRYLESFMNKDIYYFTGANLGLIMDRLGMQWKQEVESQKLVGDILLEEMKEDLEKLLSEKSEKEVIEEIKSQYGFDSYKEVGEIIAEEIE